MFTKFISWYYHKRIQALKDDNDFSTTFHNVSLTCLMNQGHQVSLRNDAKIKIYNLKLDLLHNNFRGFI